MILVKCPKCGNSMKYQPQAIPKKKSCVYCGHAIDVRKAIHKTIRE